MRNETFKSFAAVTTMAPLTTRLSYKFTSLLLYLGRGVRSGGCVYRQKRVWDGEIYTEWMPILQQKKNL